MAFSDTERIVGELYIREGMTVIDLGAGTGAYSLAAAKKVGEKGKVIAIDVQKELLTRLKNDAVAQGFSNVDIVWGDIEEGEGTGLQAEIGDVVILANTLFIVPNKKETLLEAKRLLKKGGHIALIDWSESFGGIGPAPADVFSKGQARVLLGECGFAFEREINAGDHHYGLVAIKQ